MKAFNNLKKVLSTACVYNTIAVLLLYSFGLLLPNGAGLIPKLEHLYMILLFSLALSISNLLLRSKSLNAFVRTAIHYICVSVIFYVIFIAWGGFASNGSTTIVVMLVYTVVYFIITAVYYIVRHFSNKNKEPEEDSEEDYESQFTARNG